LNIRGKQHKLQSASQPDPLPRRPWVNSVMWRDLSIKTPLPRDREDEVDEDAIPSGPLVPPTFARTLVCGV
ncbi:hypothetical protein ABG768_016531, partial [Culter alburnus]